MLRKTLRVFILFLCMIFSFGAFAASYRVVGSYKGSNDNPGLVMTLVEGSSTLYEATYTGISDILFFMILETDGTNSTFYGGPYDEIENKAVNTPLNGTYYAKNSSDDKSKVGAMFFQMTEDKIYRLTYDTESHKVELTITDVATSPLSILSSFDINKEENGTPQFRIDYTELATDLTLPITRIDITTWDIDMTKRRSGSVFSYLYEDGEPVVTLENINDLFSDYFETASAADGSKWYYDSSAYNDRGAFIYDDGEYIYRMIFYITENGKDRRYTVYSDPFTVSKDGNQLVLNAFYLVQLGDGSSNYLTLTDENHPYAYNVTESYDAIGNPNQIDFSLSSYEEGDIIDYGDETIFKFTDRVLIRSNVPFDKNDVSKIRNCTLTLNEPDATGGEIHVISSKDNPNVIKDGRFMTIVELSKFVSAPQDETAEVVTLDAAGVNESGTLVRPFSSLIYKLTMEYDDSAEGPASMEASTLPTAISVPTPSFDEIRVEVGDKYHGDFTYTSPRTGKEYTLSNGRCHTLRNVLKCNKPNLTNALGTLM